MSLGVCPLFFESANEDDILNSYVPKRSRVKATLCQSKNQSLDAVSENTSTILRHLEIIRPEKMQTCTDNEIVFNNGTAVSLDLSYEDDITHVEKMGLLNSRSNDARKKRISYHQEKNKSLGPDGENLGKIGKELCRKICDEIECSGFEIKGDECKIFQQIDSGKQTLDENVHSFIKQLDDLSKPFSQTSLSSSMGKLCNIDSKQNASVSYESHQHESVFDLQCPYDDANDGIVNVSATKDRKANTQKKRLPLVVGSNLKVLMYAVNGVAKYLSAQNDEFGELFVTLRSKNELQVTMEGRNSQFSPVKKAPRQFKRVSAQSSFMGNFTSPPNATVQMDTYNLDGSISIPYLNFVGIFKEENDKLVAVSLNDDAKISFNTKFSDLKKLAENERDRIWKDRNTKYRPERESDLLCGFEADVVVPKVSITENVYETFLTEGVKSENLNELLDDSPEDFPHLLPAYGICPNLYSLKVQTKDFDLGGGKKMKTTCFAQHKMESNQIPERFTYREFLDDLIKPYNSDAYSNCTFDRDQRHRDSHDDSQSSRFCNCQAALRNMGWRRGKKPPAYEAPKYTSRTDERLDEVKNDKEKDIARRRTPRNCPAGSVYPSFYRSFFDHFLHVSKDANEGDPTDPFIWSTDKYERVCASENDTQCRRKIKLGGLKNSQKLRPPRGYANRGTEGLLDWELYGLQNDDFSFSNKTARKFYSQTLECFQPDKTDNQEFQEFTTKTNMTSSEIDRKNTTEKTYPFFERKNMLINKEKNTLGAVKHKMCPPSHPFFVDLDYSYFFKDGYDLSLPEEKKKQEAVDEWRRRMYNFREKRYRGLSYQVGVTKDARTCSRFIVTNTKNEAQLFTTKAYQRYVGLRFKTKSAIEEVTFTSEWYNAFDPRPRERKKAVDGRLKAIEKAATSYANKYFNSESSDWPHAAIEITSTMTEKKVKLDQRGEIIQLRQKIDVKIRSLSYPAAQSRKDVMKTWLQKQLEDDPNKNFDDYSSDTTNDFTRNYAKEYSEKPRYEVWVIAPHQKGSIYSNPATDLCWNEDQIPKNSMNVPLCFSYPVSQYEQINTENDRETHPLLHTFSLPNKSRAPSRNFACSVVRGDAVLSGTNPSFLPSEPIGTSGTFTNLANSLQTHCRPGETWKSFQEVMNGKPQASWTNLMKKFRAINDNIGDCESQKQLDNAKLLLELGKHKTDLAAGFCCVGDKCEKSTVKGVCPASKKHWIDSRETELNFNEFGLCCEKPWKNGKCENFIAAQSPLETFARHNSCRERLCRKSGSLCKFFGKKIDFGLDSIEPTTTFLLHYGPQSFFTSTWNTARQIRQLF